MSDYIIKILLVDCSKTDSGLVQDVLSRVHPQKYKVEVAARFDTGMAMLRKHHFDACLVDSLLGDRHGIEFIKHVRRLTNSPPLVMLTGMGDHRVGREAISAGATDYVQKSELSPALLECSIRYAMDRRRCELQRDAATRQLKEQVQSQAALQEQLVTTSRQIGMAEVATGVLHNVGNVLNSVNVSATLLLQNILASQTESLERAAEVIARQEDLAQFVTEDQHGRYFPQLLSELATSLREEKDIHESELRSLIDSVEHVKQIISMQQSFAQVSGTAESLNIADLLDDAIIMNDAGLLRHNVNVVREIDEDVPLINTDRHKILQILVNLISNAKHALTAADGDNNTLTLSVASGDDGVRILVRDNGLGIPRENLTKIFDHGFTTKTDGHGFGLHSSALTAQDLGGSLSAHSDGPGHGATFSLHLPIEKEAVCPV